MTLELRAGEKPLGQIATMRGYGEMVDWVSARKKTLPALARMFEHGGTRDIEAVREDVRRALAQDPPATIAGSLHAVDKALARGKGLVRVA